LTGIAVAAVWFAVFAALHVAGLRAGIGNARSLMRAYVTCIAGTLLTVVALGGALGHSVLAVTLAVVTALLTSACLFVLYVPAIYTVLTSLSVQTLLLLERDGGSYAESALYERFAGQSLFEARLRTLEASGYVRLKAERYRLTSRGHTMARVFAGIKRFWQLNAGG